MIAASYVALSRRTIAVVFVMAVVPFGLTAQTKDPSRPRGVSPGSTVTAEVAAQGCSTFSWSGVVDAAGYELVLYRVDADGALQVALEVHVPADASSWTPSASACPAPGGEYAWSVRALTEASTSAWSQPLLFATPGTPTEDEVRPALATLRRYRDREVGEGLVPSRNVDTRFAVDAGNGLAPPALDRPIPLWPPQDALLRSDSSDALTSPTVDDSLPQVVTAPSSYAFNLSGDMHLGGAIFKDGYPVLHTDGLDNVAVGESALTANTGGSRNTAVGKDALLTNTSGYLNTAVGKDALRFNTEGHSNTGLGHDALESNTTGIFNTAVGTHAMDANAFGSRNTAVGGLALLANTSGYYNTAVGYKAMYANQSGRRNTAVGKGALSSVTGDYNTAIGVNAGYNWTTGDSNIAVGDGAYGVAGEEDTIRIGGVFQDRAFIAGIASATGTFNDHDVCIENDGQLGPCGASSARFKTDVEALAAAPDLAELEPVSYRYKKEISGEESPILRYGLIAEQVAEIFPSLVGHDSEGRPSTVRYALLTPLLLAEIQRQEKELVRLRSLDRGLTELKQTVADQQRQLDKLAKE